MAVELPSQIHRLSLEEYRGLVEAGVFEDAHVELIDGYLVDMSPKSAAHENVVAWLNDLLGAGIDRQRFQVRIAASLSLGASEPEPDVAVIDRAAPRPYHPGTAVLVIEVAVSSLKRDLVEKPPIYARAGVPDYWVADLDGRRMVTHTSPTAGGYSRADVVGPDGELRPSRLEIPPISVAELLAAADA